MWTARRSMLCTPSRRTELASLPPQHSYALSSRRSVYPGYARFDGGFAGVSQDAGVSGGLCCPNWIWGIQGAYGDVCVPGRTLIDWTMDFYKDSQRTCRADRKHSSRTKVKSSHTRRPRRLFLFVVPLFIHTHLLLSLRLLHYTFRPSHP
jgi:hypothetical protein